jgi:hypothetical protein
MSCLLTFLKMTKPMTAGTWVPVYFAFCAVDPELQDNEGFLEDAVNSGIVFG